MTVVSWVTRARMEARALLGVFAAVWAGCVRRLGGSCAAGVPWGRSEGGGDGRWGSICIAGLEVGAPGQVRA